MLESLKEKIQSGQEICPEEALWLAEKAELRPLLDVAQEITAQCAPRRFDLCSIINAKSGRCPEDCKWCAQSAHYHTGSEIYPLVSEEECLRHARVNEASGIGRFSLVTSGRRLSDREVDEMRPCTPYTCQQRHPRLRVPGTALRGEPAQTIRGRSNQIPL